jgi:hypothetical protein
MVTKAKIQSWQDFITEEGNKEPWGIAYKRVTGNFRREETVSTLRTPQGDNANCWSIAKAMLSALISDDQEEADTPEQVEIRRNMDTPPNTEDAPACEFRKLGGAVARLRKEKCPGPDLIEAEVIQRTWGLIHQELFTLMNGCLTWGVFPKHWDVGNVVTLPKGPEREGNNPTGQFACFRW